MKIDVSYAIAQIDLFEWIAANTSIDFFLTFRMDLKIVAFQHSIYLVQFIIFTKSHHVYFLQRAFYCCR